MVKTSRLLKHGMFYHPAWAVGSYSSGTPAAVTKSTGGFNHPDGLPCMAGRLTGCDRHDATRSAFIPLIDFSLSLSSLFLIRPELLINRLFEIGSCPEGGRDGSIRWEAKLECVRRGYYWLT